MIAPALFSLCAVNLLPAAEDNAKAELKRWQGTWTYENQTIGGRELPKKDREAIWVEVDDDVLTKVRDSGRLKLKMTLDPTTSPKSIDLVFHWPISGKDYIHKGIYEWDGEKLRMCFDETGKGRPTEFRSPEGKDNIYLSVLKRKEK
jgi:uncharacterized protein (TIGR03067 family)